MFFTADTSIPFIDITDALTKGFNVIVLAADTSATIIEVHVNADNPEFIKFSNNIKVSNTSLVKSFEDGVR